MLVISSARAGSLSLSSQLALNPITHAPELIVNHYDRIGVYETASSSLKLTRELKLHGNILSLDQGVVILANETAPVVIFESESISVLHSDQTLYLTHNHITTALPLPYTPITISLIDQQELVLALLHSTPPILSLYSINIDQNELQPLSITLPTLTDPAPEIIIPIHPLHKSHERGIIVVGESSLQYIPLPSALVTFSPVSSPDAAATKGKSKAIVQDDKKANSKRASESTTNEPKKQKRDNDQSRFEELGNEGTSVTCAMPVGLIQAWTALPTKPDLEPSFLLGDIYGKLFYLSLIRRSDSADQEAGTVAELTLKDLGDTSSPTSLTPVSSSTIYLGSRFADSQLIRLPSFISKTLQDPSFALLTALRAQRIEAGLDVSDIPLSTTDDYLTPVAEEAEGEIELVQTYTSLAPILDACVISSDVGGASQIITCSGAYKGGSLRVVRQGVGLNELVTVDLEGVLKIFGIGSVPSMTERVDWLILSFFSSTRILKLSSPPSSFVDEESETSIEEIELPSRIVNTVPTLWAGRIGSLVAQVMTANVSYFTFCSASSASVMGEGKTWSPSDGKKITLAAQFGAYLALALDGGFLVLLSEVDGSLAQIAETTFANEIACLSMSSFASRSPTLHEIPILAVGQWTSQTLTLLTLPSLSVLVEKVVESEYLMRSVVVVEFDDAVRMVFCGMGDGMVWSYSLSVSASDDSPVVRIVKGSDKAVTLGKKPIVLSLFTAANDAVGNEAGRGGSNVLVSSDRPTVISRAFDKLVYSSVNLLDTITIAPLSTPLYPSSLAFATPTTLKIGQINSIQKVDILTIPLEEDEPRRIVHMRESGTIGVVCLGRDVDRTTGEQKSWGCFKVFNEGSYEVLKSIPLQEHEEGQSLAVVHPTSSPNSSRHGALYLIGTAFIDPSETEPTRGRLILVGFVDAALSSDMAGEGEEEAKEGRWEIVGEIEVKGCPYALVGVSQGCFAVAVSSQVQVYSITPSHAPELLTTWSGAFIPLTLSSLPLVAGDEILVGDAIRSLILLRFDWKPTSPKLPTLKEVARDYRSRYLTAAEWVDYPSTAALPTSLVEDEATEFATEGSTAMDETPDTVSKAEVEFIGADIDLNLFTVRKEVATTSRSMEDEFELRKRGNWHLGEMVSKFARGSLVQQYSTSLSFIIPKLLFVTSAGSIGVVSTVTEESSKILSDLERNLREVVDAAGGITQEHYRSTPSAISQRTVSAGFIDGTFVESFLELSDEDQDKVMAGSNEFEKIQIVGGRDGMVRMLEEVGRMH